MGIVRTVVVGVVAVGCAGGALGAPVEEVVFENLTVDTSHALGVSIEVGDEVTLGGTGRALSRAELALYSGAGGSFDVRFRIYANDGAAGAPGTMLYDSGVFGVSHAGGGTELLGLALPLVSVPDTLTWTLENVEGTTGLYLRAFEPPTIGSSANAYWARSGVGWGEYGPSSYGGNFGARLTAVPPAGTMWVAAVGGLVAGVRRRR